MKCDKCGAKLRVTHTYPAGSRGRTSAAVCRPCGKRYTVVALLYCEVNGVGTGPQAVGKEVEAGQLEIKRAHPQEQERGRAQAGAGEAPVT